MSETLGSEIKRLRKELGMTQKQLADVTELSQGYIAQIETDVRHAKYADTMNKLCVALKVPLGHFVQWVSPGLTIPRGEFGYVGQCGAGNETATSEPRGR